MKITQKTNYSLRFMLRLAVSYNKCYVGLKEIAEKEDIPLKFMENIAASLKKEGMVIVQRGAGGGYMLSRSPEKILLWDIFQIFEGKTLYAGYVHDFQQSQVTALVVSTVWVELQAVISRYLLPRNLKDLVVDFDKRISNQMFYI